MSRQKFQQSINFILVIIAVAVSIYVGTSMNGFLRPGLGFLFLLPLCFGLVSCWIFPVQRLKRSGIAVKVFYIILIIRYLLLPLLMVLTKGSYNALPVTMPMTTVSKEGYNFAVLAMLIELFASMSALRYYSNKFEKKYEINITSAEIGIKNRGISVVGLGITALFMVQLLRRNLSTLMSTFSFLTIEDKYENPMTDAYGIVLALTLKTIIFLVLLNFFVKQYRETTAFRWAIAAAIVAVLNMGIFFGYNRSLVLQTAITTIYVLYLCFPKYRKAFLFGLIPVVFLTMTSMIFIKQFGVSYAGAELSNFIDFSGVSNTLECYVCGPWAEACGYDAAVSAGLRQPIATFFKDLIGNSFLSYLPGLTWLLNLFPDVVQSTHLHQQFSNSAQMIPLTAQCAYYVGTIFSPVLSSFFIVGFMRILVWSDYKGKYCADIFKKYAYTLNAMLFSFCLCYTWVTLLWCFTKCMLFVFAFVYLNEFHYAGNGIISRIRTERNK